MATQTKMTAGGILRHFHVAEGRDRMIWHRAGTYHPEDPDAHEREDSWNSPNWIDGWRHTADERDTWISEAEVKHDRTREARIGAGTFSPQPSIASRHTPAHTPTAVIDGDNIETNDADEANYQADIDAEVAATPNDAGVIRAASVESVLALDERTSNVEELFVALSSRLDETNQTLADVADFPEVLARVTALEEAAGRTVTIQLADNSNNILRTLEGTHHQKFPLLLRLATNLEPEDRNIWITGPAGAGKTMGSVQLAAALDLPFETQPPVSTPFQLSGFIDAGGTYHGTAFRNIYENGGVWLGDEIDASTIAALLEINGALSSDRARFPDRMVMRHPNCYILCAANTWGFGGDANYVGRNKIDAAFLDRFVTIHWTYDHALEAVRANHESWVAVVQNVRERVASTGSTIIVSPRASIKGAQLLNKGMTPAEVVEAIFGRYRGHSAWSSVGTAAERFAEQSSIVSVERPVITTNGTAPTPSTRPSPQDITNLNFSGVRVFGQ